MHCEKTHGNSLLDPAVLSIFLCKGGGLARCRENVRGCYAGKRLCSLFMFSQEIYQNGFELLAKMDFPDVKQDR